MKLKKKHTNQDFEVVDGIGKYMDDDIQRIIEGKQLELGDRELPPFDEYRIYKNIQEAVMQEEKRKNRRIRMPLFFKWAVACIIVLFAVGAGYNFYQSRCEANLVYREVCAVRGEKLLVLLPDGSRVWLNADSKLTYPEQFAKYNRDVTLEGEAYFEVTKDATRPFIVEANGMEVKVYGTRFNVNTRRDDQIQTTLVEGSVSVKPKGLKEVMLEPNQQAVFNKLAGRVTVRDVDVMSYVAWQRGNYYFENKSIGEILDELSLWYDIQVFFMNNEVRNERFSGYLPRYEEIDRLLSLIEKTSHVQFEIKGRVIIVRK